MIPSLADSNRRRGTANSNNKRSVNHSRSHDMILNLMHQPEAQTFKKNSRKLKHGLLIGFLSPIALLFIVTGILYISAAKIRRRKQIPLPNWRVILSPTGKVPPQPLPRPDATDSRHYSTEDYTVDSLYRRGDNACRACASRRDGTFISLVHRRSTEADVYAV